MAISAASAVDILLADGAGGFVPGPAAVPLTGNAHIGDVNGDGKADLVAAAANGQISVALGIGGGSFAAPVEDGAAGEDFGDQEQTRWRP